MKPPADTEQTMTANTNADRAAVLAEMMERFNTARLRCRAQHPNATDEEVFQMVSAAMNRSLGLDRARA